MIKSIMKIVAKCELEKERESTVVSRTTSAFFANTLLFVLVIVICGIFILLLLARVLGLYGKPVSLAGNAISDVRTIEEKELQKV